MCLLSECVWVRVLLCARLCVVKRERKKRNGISGEQEMGIFLLPFISSGIGPLPPDICFAPLPLLSPPILFTPSSNLPSPVSSTLFSTAPRLRLSFFSRLSLSINLPHHLCTCFFYPSLPFTSLSTFPHRFPFALSLIQTSVGLKESGLREAERGEPSDLKRSGRTRPCACCCTLARLHSSSSMDYSYFPAFPLPSLPLISNSFHTFFISLQTPLLIAPLSTSSLCTPLVSGSSMICHLSL